MIRLDPCPVIMPSPTMTLTEAVRFFVHWHAMRAHAYWN